ncbi:MAG TPA: DUF711 family protein [Pyrinomonadaceae bacterium]|nr:DUF711 family protein [Pyrinomonadaceae bacterium]
MMKHFGVRRFLTSALLLTLLATSISSANARLIDLKPNTFSQTKPPARTHRFRIRTITAGVNLESTSDLKTIQSAIEFLQHARKKYEDAGYEIQTVRIATQPFSQYLNGKSRAEALEGLKKIDEVLSANNVILSIGPAITTDRHDPEFAPWAAQLIQQTKNISLSVTVASERGIHTQTVLTAAETIVAISKASPGGEGNFRFAAAANVTPGPFFPVAYHRGPVGFSIGLETPRLLQQAFEQANGIKDIVDAQQKLLKLLDAELGPVERLAEEISQNERREYFGIDTSPAPSKDASIGAAIEAFTHAPFGASSTLLACAAITEVLKSLKIKICGYSGLMLPVLEDPVLATRAAEGRYTVRELLLYSSVCGTGLDVVPLPGDTSTADLAALISDVAALSSKLRKPLAARLFLIPGKKAGDRAEFTNPFLTSSVVMKLE